MKKWFAWILVLAMLAVSMTACGEKAVKLDLSDYANALFRGPDGEGTARGDFDYTGFEHAILEGAVECAGAAAWPPRHSCDLTSFRVLLRDPDQQLRDLPHLGHGGVFIPAVAVAAAGAEVGTGDPHVGEHGPVGAAPDGFGPGLQAHGLDGGKGVVDEVPVGQHLVVHIIVFADMLDFDRCFPVHTRSLISYPQNADSFSGRIFFREHPAESSLPRNKPSVQGVPRTMIRP